MFRFLQRFEPDKLKSSLRMAIQRIQIQSKRNSDSVKQAKQEVATFLAEKKNEKARVKAESIVRQILTFESLDAIKSYCELLIERVQLITTERYCPSDLNEIISTLMWASNRAGIEELENVSEQLTRKYGTDFHNRAMSNQENCVNPTIFEKLTVSIPAPFLVQNFLLETAHEYQIDWVPTDLGALDDCIDDMKQLSEESESVVPITLEPYFPSSNQKNQNQISEAKYDQMQQFPQTPFQDLNNDQENNFDLNELTRRINNLRK